MVRESDIVYENPTAWVLKERDAYAVMTTGLTHSTNDSAYALTEDGLSIAVARAGYLEKAMVRGVLKDLWTPAMQLAAMQEGWDLWTSFGSESGPLQVQCFDDLEEAQLRASKLAKSLGVPDVTVPGLASDDDAQTLLARGTGVHHAVAMRVLAKCNPIEATLIGHLQDAALVDAYRDAANARARAACDAQNAANPTALFKAKFEPLSDGLLAAYRISGVSPEAAADQILIGESEPADGEAVAPTSTMG